MTEAASQCPQMKDCEMFPLFNLQGALQVWKIRYCTADYSACERYRRASAGRTVPANLMPNGALLKKP